MNQSQGLFSKQYPSPMEPPSLEGNLHGGGQKPSTSPKSLGHQAGASPILG